MGLQKFLQLIGSSLGGLGYLIERLLRPVGLIFKGLATGLRWLSRGPHWLSNQLHDHWPGIRQSLTTYSRAFTASFNASTTAVREARRQESSSPTAKTGKAEE